MSRIIVRTIILLLFLAVFLGGCGPVMVIQSGEIGVVFNVLTGELEDPIGPGTHFVNPMAEVTIYPTGRQEYRMSDYITYGQMADNPDAVLARTQDGQEVRISAIVLYNLDRWQINMIHARWQDHYPDGFVRPTLRSVVREVTATYDARDIYAGGRADFETEIQDELSTRLSSEGLVLQMVLITSINFTPEYSATIEAQLIATMTAEAPQALTPIVPIP